MERVRAASIRILSSSFSQKHVTVCSLLVLSRVVCLITVTFLKNDYFLGHGCQSF